MPVKEWEPAAGAEQEEGGDDDECSPFDPRDQQIVPVKEQQRAKRSRNPTQKAFAVVQKLESLQSLICEVCAISSHVILLSYTRNTDSSA